MNTENISFNISTEIKKIFEKNLQEVRKDYKINSLNDLFEEIGLDSLVLFESIIEIETLYNIEFDNEDLKSENLKNLKDIITIVEKLNKENLEK